METRTRSVFVRDLLSISRRYFPAAQTSKGSFFRIADVPARRGLAVGIDEVDRQVLHGIGLNLDGHALKRCQRPGRLPRCFSARSRTMRRPPTAVSSIRTESSRWLAEFFQIEEHNLKLAGTDRARGAPSRSCLPWDSRRRVSDRARTSRGRHIPPTCLQLKFGSVCLRRAGWWPTACHFSSALAQHEGKGRFRLEVIRGRQDAAARPGMPASRAQPSAKPNPATLETHGTSAKLRGEVGLNQPSSWLRQGPKKVKDYPRRPDPGGRGSCRAFSAKAARQEPRPPVPKSFQSQFCLDLATRPDTMACVAYRWGARLTEKAVPAWTESDWDLLLSRVAAGKCMPVPGSGSELRSAALGGADRARLGETVWLPLRRHRRPGPRGPVPGARQGPGISEGADPRPHRQGQAARLPGARRASRCPRRASAAHLHDDELRRLHDPGAAPPHARRPA